MEQPELSEHAAVGTVFGTTTVWPCLTETGQMLTPNPADFLLGIGPAAEMLPHMFVERHTQDVFLPLYSVQPQSRNNVNVHYQ